MKAEIIPSILVRSSDELKTRLSSIGNRARAVQLDVLDETLVPYRSFYDPGFIEGLSPKNRFEVHLMVTKPVFELAAWDRPWVKKIIFHAESEANVASACSGIVAMGKRAGVAFSPQTSFSAALLQALKIDTILIMTVEPGRNGAPFLPRELSKVKAARRAFPKMNIEVDGGINPKTIRACKEAGANLFVAGSFLQNERFEERYKQLAQAVQ